MTLIIRVKLSRVPARALAYHHTGSRMAALGAQRGEAAWQQRAPDAATLAKMDPQSCHEAT